MRIEQELPEKNMPGKRTADGKLKLACLVFALLLLFIGIRTYMDMGTLKETIAGQEAELAALDKEIDARGGPRSEAQKAGDNAPGGTEKEDAPDIAFLRKLLTWDSYEDYCQVRDWLKNDCNAGKKEQLLSEFMPNVKEDGFGDANMKFKEADVYAISQNGGSTEYFALCKVSNRINGNVGTGKAGVFFSMDKENNISKVSAYTLAR